MANDKTSIKISDPWDKLKRFTRARIALGRTGSSLLTGDVLEFQLAHALARDAVDISLDFNVLEQALNQDGCPTLRLQTCAGNRQEYLQRPDLGRLLNQSSITKLQTQTKAKAGTYISLVIADGLSSSAIANHGRPLINKLVPVLQERGFILSPICLVEQGRVAIGDDIAERLSARFCVVLIGERPGLSSPDSMGIYFTYQARVGRTDVDRNCISNIHQNGLSYQEAIIKLLYLLGEAERLKFSGVNLKDQAPMANKDIKIEKSGNFLLEK